MPDYLGASFMMSENTDAEHEVLRRNHWEIQIQGIDSIIAAQNFNPPNYDVEKIEVPHYNDVIKIAGKTTPGDLRVDLLDFVKPNIAGQVWDWFKLVYDPNTSKRKYASRYKRQARIFLYDPEEVLLRTWSLKGLFPLNNPFGGESYDYSSHDVVKIAMAFSVDYCTMDGAAAGATSVI